MISLVIFQANFGCLWQFFQRQCELLAATEDNISIVFLHISKHDLHSPCTSLLEGHRAFANNWVELSVQSSCVLWRRCAPVLLIGCQQPASTEVGGSHRPHILHILFCNSNNFLPFFPLRTICGNCSFTNSHYSQINFIFFKVK